MNPRAKSLPILLCMLLTQFSTPSSATVPMISAGEDHALALKRDGTVWAWGDSGGHASIGRRGGEITSVPVRVSGIADVIAVSAGGRFSLALKSDGTVWQWGAIQVTTNPPVVVVYDLPSQVFGLTDVVAISAGYSHALALKSDGSVWAWGASEHGELGYGLNHSTPNPVRVRYYDHNDPNINKIHDFQDVVAISAGYQCSTALRKDGRVYTWGSNEYAQLGALPTYKDSYFAMDDIGLTNVKTIDARSWNGLAVKNDGTVWGWGRNSTGSLGSGPDKIFAPVRIPGLSWPAAISSGGPITLAAERMVFTHGLEVLAMGQNTYGGLGIGSLVPAVSSTPVQVKGLMHVTSISAGFLFNLATTNDGQVWAWGENSHRQLGLGNGWIALADQLPMPVQSQINIYSHTPDKPRADLNGDGRNDILWRNTATGEVKAWLMNGATVSSSATLLPAGNGGWDVAGSGDLDGDGKADIVWYNPNTGEIKAWLMNGTTKLAEASLVGPGNNVMTVAGVGDLDGDGKADIVWRNSTDNAYYAWLMNGTVKRGEASLLGGGSNPTWRIAGMGDLDGDGLADVVWRDLSTGQATVWLRTVTHSATNAVLLPAGNAAWTLAGVGDLDADGKDDIVWRNAVTGEVKAWLMNGSAKSSESGLLGTGNLVLNIVGMGDINGDGMADILWRNTSTGEVKVWLMSGSVKYSEASLQSAGNIIWSVVNK